LKRILLFLALATLLVAVTLSGSAIADVMDDPNCPGLKTAIVTQKNNPAETDDLHSKAGAVYDKECSATKA
jgi:hypothetical protein